MEKKPEWMSDPLVSGIEENKLEFLCDLVFSGRGKSGREGFLHLSRKMQEARQAGIHFSSEEISAVIAAIKKHSSPQELEQINAIMAKKAQADS